MSFRMVAWAFSLRGVSPLAKLVAIGVSNHGDDPESGGVVVGIRSLVNWVGCDYDNLLDALAELKRLGVGWRDDGRGNFVINIPNEPSIPTATTSLSEPKIAIYVISSGSASKIGISRDPDNRMYSLQGGSPSQLMVRRYVGWGPATAIRAAEKASHARLMEQSLGREWFAASPEECISVVKEELWRLGVDPNKDRSTS